MGQLETIRVPIGLTYDNDPLAAKQYRIQGPRPGPEHGDTDRDKRYHHLINAQTLRAEHCPHGQCSERGGGNRRPQSSEEQGRNDHSPGVTDKLRMPNPAQWAFPHQHRHANRRSDKKKSDTRQRVREGRVEALHECGLSRPRAYDL